MLQTLHQSAKQALVGLRIALDCVKTSKLVLVVAQNGTVANTSRWPSHSSQYCSLGLGVPNFQSNFELSSHLYAI